jgi:hypothetical protein
MIPLVNLDALMLQLKHGEMELSLIKDMLRAGVVIIAEPKGYVNPLYTMIENENLLDSFLDEILRGSDDDDDSLDGDDGMDNHGLQMSACTGQGMELVKFDLTI